MNNIAILLPNGWFVTFQIILEKPVKFCYHSSASLSPRPRPFSDARAIKATTPGPSMYNNYYPDPYNMVQGGTLKGWGVFYKRYIHSALVLVRPTLV